MAQPEFVQSLWARLQRRDKWPRRWWYPLQNSSPQKPADEAVQKNYEECVLTVRRTMLVLLAFSLFCIVTVFGTPDGHLVASEAKLKLPFADTDIGSRYFLVAAPLLLIVLTLYLHVFDRRRLKYAALYKISPVDTLFTLNEPLPNALSQFIFFWLVPLVLLAITWKALVRLEWGLPLLAVTLLVAASLFWIKIRRCPAEQRLRNIPRWVVLIGLVCVAAFAVWDQQAFRRPLNLFRANLADKWLLEADLRGADLRGANLQGAILYGANLQAAILQEANLQGADLLGANLPGVSLRAANLQGADLFEAQLQGADLSEARLQNADLNYATIWLTVPPLRDECCENAKLDFLIEMPSVEVIKALKTSFEYIADDRLRKRVAARLEELLNDETRQGWEGSEDYKAWVLLRDAATAKKPSVGSDDEKIKKSDEAVEANQPEQFRAPRL